MEHFMAFHSMRKFHEYATRTNIRLHWFGSQWRRVSFIRLTPVPRESPGNKREGIPGELQYRKATWTDKCLEIGRLRDNLETLIFIFSFATIQSGLMRTLKRVIFGRLFSRLHYNIGRGKKYNASIMPLNWWDYVTISTKSSLPLKANNRS